MAPPSLVENFASASTSTMEYTRLGRSGLKISKVILGAMSFGLGGTGSETWTLPEEKALPILKYAFDNGINTWDTADVYSLGDSERILGAALRKYNIPREKVVILSKCGGGCPKPEEMEGLSEMEKIARLAINDGAMVNRIGLSRKHIFEAVDASVERLGTYIDVLQLHRLDRDTPKEEIMKALNDVVESGKVRYVGASSMYAWEFQALNNLAEKNGWHKLVSMQNYYSLLHREEEREMHAYCNDAGIGLIPWSPLARGLLARPYKASSEQPTTRQKEDLFTTMLIGPVTAEDVAIIGRVEELAKAKGCSMAQIGIAWCLKKGVNPILGLSSTQRVDEAVGAVKRHKAGLLTDDDVQYLDELYLPKAPLSGGW